MTRVLLTGATGFLGVPVLRALAAAGSEVHAVTSRPLATVPTADAGVTWHRADLLQPGESGRLLACVRPEALLHLAWYATPPGYWTSPLNVRWVEATLELARGFIEAGGRRFVGAGTCAEYDWTGGLCDEASTPIAPRTLYGTAKAAAGSVVRSLSAQAGVSAAWARLFFLLGPGDHPARLVPSLVQALAGGREARCTSGRLVRDFLHVDDAASALVALLRSEVTGGINIASGEPAALEMVARAVAERLERPGLLRVDPGTAEDPVVVAGVERLRGEVGWRPARTLQEAVDDTVDWWAARTLSGGVSDAARD